MSLADYLSAERIWLNFTAGTKAEALEKLSRFAADRLNLSSEETAAVIKAREKLGSTAFGGGAALPHGRLPGLAAPSLFLALAPQGVPFDSPDGEPTRILALTLTGTERGEYLRLLARLGALLKSPEASAGLLAVADPAEAVAFLSRY